MATFSRRWCIIFDFNNDGQINSDYVAEFRKQIVLMFQNRELKCSVIDPDGVRTPADFEGKIATFEKCGPFCGPVDEQFHELAALWPDLTDPVRAEIVRIASEAVISANLRSVPGNR